MAAASPQRIPLGRFRSPRHWPTWAGIGFMWLAAQLPLPAQLRLGRIIGWLALRLAAGRRRVCEENLKRCFPELDGKERKRLVRRAFAANGIGLIEIAIAWCANRDRYLHLATLSGREHLEQALATGRGVLLMACHQTTFEIAAFLLSGFFDLGATYRANDRNPLFDAFMYNRRRRTHEGLFERRDVRGAARWLKSGGVLWYAPDQDYGERHSVFVPFFGNPAATITAGGRIARFNDSPVLFFSHYRLEDDSGYLLRLSPMPDGYPSGDDAKDAIAVNRMIEGAIRRQPDQYLWLHRRFKTPPPGAGRRE